MIIQTKNQPINFSQKNLVYSLIEMKNFKIFFNLYENNEMFEYYLYFKILFNLFYHEELILKFYYAFYFIFK